MLMTLAGAGGASPDPLPAVPIATIPIEIASNYVRLPLSIQGSRPFHLILDTGMPTRGVLLCPSPRVDSLGLEYRDGKTVRGAGGTGAGMSTRVARAAQIT